MRWTYGVAAALSTNRHFLGIFCKAAHSLSREEDKNRVSEKNDQGDLMTKIRATHSKEMAGLAGRKLASKWALPGGSKRLTKLLLELTVLYSVTRSGVKSRSTDTMY